MRVGRNEPCPCKSGKKYKKCCLKNKGYVTVDGFHRAAENNIPITKQMEETEEGKY